MPEVSYRFTDSVEKAIVAERERLLRWRKAHLISSEQVREMMESFMARCLYGARLEDNPDRAVGVKCGDCERVHVIPVSVKSFRCKCSPGVDRMTAVSRVPLS